MDSSLPTELWWCIFQYLISPCDIITCCLVSKEWNNIINDNIFWKNLYKIYFNEDREKTYYVLKNNSNDNNYTKTLVWKESFIHTFINLKKLHSILNLSLENFNNDKDNTINYLKDILFDIDIFYCIQQNELLSFIKLWSFIYSDIDHNNFIIVFNSYKNVSPCITDLFKYTCMLTTFQSEIISSSHLYKQCLDIIYEYSKEIDCNNLIDYIFNYNNETNIENIIKTKKTEFTCSDIPIINSIDIINKQIYTKKQKIFLKQVVEVLFSIGDWYYYNSNYLNSLEYSRKAYLLHSFININKSNKTSMYLVTFLRNVSGYYWRINIQDKVCYYFMKSAMKILKSLKNTIINKSNKIFYWLQVADITNGLGNIELVYNVTNAINYYKKGLEIIDIHANNHISSFLALGCIIDVIPDNDTNYYIDRINQLEIFYFNWNGEFADNLCSDCTKRWLDCYYIKDNTCIPKTFTFH